jgi:hypothetical protein
MTETLEAVPPDIEALVDAVLKAAARSGWNACGSPCA